MPRQAGFGTVELNQSDQAWFDKTWLNRTWLNKIWLNKIWRLSLPSVLEYQNRILLRQWMGIAIAPFLTLAGMAATIGSAPTRAGGDRLAL